jgi:UDP-glucose 4-epimerase
MAVESRSRVLVTGGSGFIGRRLVRALVGAGADVTVADRRPFPGGQVRTILGDLCDPAVVARVIEPGTDAVYHLAAVTRVLLSIEDPAGTYQLNVDATAGLLEQARRHGVGTFVLASTNAVTGDVGTSVITERTLLRPLTPYGATKAAAELLLGAYASCYGMTCSSLRFTNVYGPGMQEKDSLIPRLMRAAAAGRGIEVYGDGSQVRDLVHVDDVVAGIFAAWRAQHTGPLILGSGEPVSVSDILAAARSVTGAELPAQQVPPKPGEMPAVIVDISAAKALGYKPAHDLKSGIATVWPEFSEGAK